ncbi:glycosyltransferase family 2 protein [Limoniibacter endophyticus]|uniref:Glycosyltransferase 2-like domain-containing protein n=1 Tax=Limoniibacter endophyticus TaxID=1565040 RepID=A0A8J3DT83_9HYPH|nr:glycosyltransferase family 2 protein [Limoniibacter endophyticus]GHC80243.1 hypothetical protein GCM10010136_33220 [Limoniibacter endophyticus]
MSTMQRTVLPAITPAVEEKIRAIVPVYPELGEWQALLRTLRLSEDSQAILAAQARLRKVSLLQVMRDHPAIGETVLYKAIARAAGIVYRPYPLPSDLLFSDDQASRLLRRHSCALFAPLRRGTLSIHFAMPFDVLEYPGNFARLCAMSAEVKESFCLIPPLHLRQALFIRSRDLIAHRATYDIALNTPEHSARQVVAGGQTFILCTIVLILISLSLSSAPGFWPGLHFLASSAFLVCVLLRVFAATEARAVPAPTMPELGISDDPPIYTVLIALYREADVVPQLLVALGKLVWPRERLEIKLVCEEGDHETIAAIEAQPLRSFVELIKVPRFGPQTKPKALAYALQASSGSLVVLYDAEDRPHSLQLMEAWERFRDEGPELACLQAPLDIDNRHEGTLARMFWFEYCGLFKGLLPWLAKRGLIMPLGGTSNHFRREALEKVGGWDPFNVTEDADLGVRLARHGYRCGVLSLPTLEDAPISFKDWLPQRTRWMKGWMQTWLVHMRHPLRLVRQIGLKSFILVQVLFAGMLLSAMVHPLLVFSVISTVGMAILSEDVTQYSVLIGVDIAVLSLGYVSFLLLGHRTLAPKQKRGFWKVAMMTPVYWCLLALAGWRAFFQLMRRPHHWEKTTHKPSNKLLAPSGNSLDAAE